MSLQLEIFETLYDLRRLRSFSGKYLEAIGEVDAGTRDKIIRRLKENGVFTTNSVRSIDQRFLSSESVQSLGEWAASTPVILDGRPFSFERHEYLIEPYADTHP